MKQVANRGGHEVLKAAALPASRRNASTSEPLSSPAPKLFWDRRPWTKYVRTSS